MLKFMKTKFTGIASFIAAALILGFLIPLSAGLTYSWFVERGRIESELERFHSNTVNFLSLSVEDALLSFSPNDAQNAAKVIIHDPRVLQIEVFSSLYDMFLVQLDKQPIDPDAYPLTLQKDIVAGGEEIGYVKVTIDREYFFDKLDREQVNILILFLAMLMGGLAVVVPAIYFKILRPINCLTRQAQILSAGHLEVAFTWQGSDELTNLGKTFETMRQKLRSSFQQIHDLAIKDELTGLSNRRAFVETVGLALAQSNRYDKPLSLVMIDIDYFKRINDTLGHVMGDRVLKEFAFVIRSSVRKSDIVARIGGEEFALCMPETCLEDACLVTEKIRQNLAAHHFPENQHITASFGVAQHQGATFDQLLERADTALYRAKNSGRNRVEVSPNTAQPNITH
ncbi:GGDEF domain-containing protein [Desulfovibrio inopinatus]|uniref:GGDEF domain-containing protein n=1 Tax=Desulfovibrio inopinatus TaxID=102109 RepID=UPI00040A2C5C|nr:sensor domain-containing diguanylate cyclase [Desulfovibrio inopinatus]